MNQETFRAQLEKLSAGQLVEIEQLAGSFRQHAALAIAGIAEEAKRPGERGETARSVLTETGSAVYSQLLAGLITDEEKVSGWHLMAVGGTVNALEDQVEAGLRKALGDRRIVPIPPGFELAEEAVPEQRICDLAYLGLRRNLAPETELIGMVAADQFSKMPELERNHEIVHFAQSGKFTPLGVPVEEEP